MIEVEQLTKRFPGRTAVDGISFRVPSGEIVGFLGPNGAGKTTTLRMITGFLPPTGGRVTVDGVDSRLRPLEARRRIGYMPEGAPLHEELRVSEYLRFRAELKGVPRADRKRAVERSLEQAAVSDAADRIIGQLSKGYRQRVGLADALLADPPVLVLDEPTSGLDPNQIRQFRALIRSAAGNKTVLLSTHILPEVEATCDRVVIIDRGHIVGEGPTDRLRHTSDETMIVLTVRGSLQRALEALEEADGVVRVVEHRAVADDVTRVRVVARDSEETAESIFRAVAAAGLALRALAPESTSLEDTFARLTREEPEDEETAEQGEESVERDEP